MRSMTHFAVAYYSAAARGTHAAAARHPSLDVVMLLGFLAVLFTLLCFLERRRSRVARFGLGLALLLTAVFGFAQGAWPLGLLHLGWAGVAFARWWTSAKESRPAKTIQRITHARRADLFGSTLSNN